jgi:vacuolar-type H+-ATPase subunit I/STV1
VTSPLVPTAFALVFTLDLHHGMLLAVLALGGERRAKISKVL